MTARRKLTLGLVVAVAATAAAALAIRTDAASDNTRMSNGGKAVTALRGLPVRTAKIRTGRVLATRGERALYRLDRGGAAACYGVGPADELGTVDAVTCTRSAFPTAVHPILDFSVYEGTRRDTRDVALFRAEGVAADGVAAVEFLRPNGDVALSVPVTQNVYATTDVPRGSIKGMAAVDKAGKRIWRSP
ncbi:MAG: hypothetical protein ACJ74D_05520 [Gaiellaceae bacterium]